MLLNLSASMKLFLARNIVTRGNTKLIAVVSEIPDTCVDGTAVSSIAFHAIDGSDRCTKPLAYDRVYIIHPKPKGCFE